MHAFEFRGERKMTRLTTLGYIVAGAILWTAASASTATAGSTLVALAYLGAARPAPILIVLTLTNLAGIMLCWLIWPIRPQITWELGPWLAFTAITTALLLVLYTYALPWYVHLLHAIA